MSLVYLFRHGQAGTRFDYDTLSEVGSRQARLLGEHLALERIPFTRLYSGTLRRQSETAVLVAETSRARGYPLPEIQFDPRWNEFDLDAVYAAYAGPLRAEEPGFEEHYQEMLRISQDDHRVVHRRWTPCDTVVMRSYIQGRYPVPGGETWRMFLDRIGATPAALGGSQEETIGVFTSATPIAIWVGLTFGFDGLKLMRLAGAALNSSYSVFQLRGPEIDLVSFNAVPHLPPELRTFR